MNFPMFSVQEIVHDYIALPQRREGGPTDLFNIFDAIPIIRYILFSYIEHGAQTSPTGVPGIRQIGRSGESN
jgi:hypothetical protein